MAECGGTRAAGVWPLLGLVLALGCAEDSRVRERDAGDAAVAADVVLAGDGDAWDEEVTPPDSVSLPDAVTAPSPCGPCPPARPHCDPVSETCRGCVWPRDCPGIGQRCIDGACVLALPCTSDKLCAPVAGVCAQGRCADCNSVKDCQLGQDCLADTCVPRLAPCKESAQCESGKCGPGETCLECIQDGDCPKGQYCLDGLCSADACAAGETGCVPGQPGVRRVCSDRGDGWVPTPCVLAGHVCQDGACKPGACVPGAVACDGLTRTVCSDGGQHMVPLENCGGKGQTCADGACVALQCQPGAPSCVGGKLGTCNANGTTLTAVGCADGATCEDGACVPALCAPGTLWCEGSKQLLCVSGTQTQVLGDCASQGQVCVAGSCLTPLCTPDTLACAGAQLQYCDPSGTNWQTAWWCAGPTPLCADGQCVGASCQIGQTKCHGKSVLTCQPDQLGWSQSPCPFGQVCGKTTTCVPQLCKTPPPSALGVVKLNAFAPRPPEEGCDLLGNGKPDNKLAAATHLFDDLQAKLANAVASGALLVVLRAPGWTSTGAPFAIEVHRGEVDPATKGCDLTREDGGCKVRLDPDGVDLAAATTAVCPAVDVLEKASVTGQKLKASAGQAGLRLPLPVVNRWVEIQLQGLRIEGGVKGSTSWKGGDLSLCGAFDRAAFVAALEALPAEAYGKWGVGKASFLATVDKELQADIDTDGDGNPDAVSAAFAVSAVPAVISGLAW